MPIDSNLVPLVEVKGRSLSSQPVDSVALKEKPTTTTPLSDALNKTETITSRKQSNILKRDTSSEVIAIDAGKKKMKSSEPTSRLY